MRLHFLGIFLLLICAGWLSAQSLSNLDQTASPRVSTTATDSSGWVKTTDSTTATTTTTTTATNAAPVYPRALPVNQPVQPAPAATTGSGDTGDMSASDFLIDGVPYAKVLYLEGNVWIRAEDDTSFHLLAEDEPIALHSVVYTGVNGILDFATGPGMAVRMVPETLVRVADLPQAASLSTSTASAPESTVVAVRKGTVFSALGRSDGEPIDFQVRTPEGVAGARGTMFATTVAEGQSQVSMLHGTVNFQTPDNQTSQITAGQSQQISGTAGGKYQVGRSQALNPAKSADFFNHAGGLLEHASGYGVVRRGLGPDVANTLRQHGYALPAATQQRFQNAAKMHYQHRPKFRSASNAHPAATGGKTGAATTPAIRPATAGQTPGAGKRRLTPEEQKQKDLEDERATRRLPGESGAGRRDKDL